MSRKHKKVCTTLKYIEHFLILASEITGFISIFAFASLLSILIGIASPALGLKNCAIAAEGEKYKSTVKKKKKKSMIKAIGLLSSLGIKAPLSKKTFLGLFLF